MDTKPLRRKLLTLAIQGRLVPQDPSDEPAAVLLDRIRAEKARLVKEGKLKKSALSDSVIFRTGDNKYYERSGKAVTCIDDQIPFEIPEAWEWVRLPQIAISELGKTLDKAKNRGQLKPYLCSINIHWSGIDLSCVKQTKFEDSELDRYLLQKGDLLICEGGDVGRSAVWESNDFMCYQNALHRVRFYSKINPYYFKSVMEAYKGMEILDKKSKGMTIKHLVQSSLNALLLPLPPLAEQRRIVAKVEEVLSVVERYEKAQDELDALCNSLNGRLRKSILQEAIQGRLVPQDPSDEPAAVLLDRINPKTKIISQCEQFPQLPDGWAVTSISDVCDNINGLWKGKKEPFVHVGVIRNANFTKDFKLDYSNIEYLDVEKQAFTKRHLMHGDLIVEKSGGSDKNPVGRAILYEGDDNVYSFSNFTMVLRIRHRNVLTSKYLYYYLLSLYQKGLMISMQTHTTGLHNLIMDKYLAIQIPLPPLAEQRRIVAKVEELFAVLDRIAGK